jgi:5-aminopentanamidase
MAGLTASSKDSKLAGKSIRIAFLHMAPRDGDIPYNPKLLEAGLHQAVEQRADLILTPELAVSGYEFFQVIGREWIQSEGTSLINHLCRFAHDHHVAMILGCPIYDRMSGKYHNAAVLIDETGRVTGVHHKHLVLPGSIEGWSDPGDEIKPVAWREHKIGLLICADAYKESLAAELAKQDAKVLVRLAAWAPGMHEPNGEWEKCSNETGLNVYVCNRTGKGTLLNFEGSSSVVVVNGHRVAEYADPQPAVLIMDVDTVNWQPVSEHFTIH